MSVLELLDGFVSELLLLLDGFVSLLLLGFVSVLLLGRLPLPLGPESLVGRLTSLLAPVKKTGLMIGI